MNSNYSKSQREIHRLKEELEKKICKNNDYISDLFDKLKSYRSNIESYAIQTGLTEKQIREMILSEIDKYQKSVGYNYGRNSIQKQSGNSVLIHSEKGQVVRSSVKNKTIIAFMGNFKTTDLLKSLRVIHAMLFMF